MTFKRADGSTCGAATYTSPHGFSFTINPPPGAVVDAGASLFIDAGDAGPTPEPYGTYASVIQPGRDAFDVTCPSGEAHHFNLFEVEGQFVNGDGGLQSICPLFSDLVPRSAFTFDPGGINTPGAVSFTIYWPPAAGTYPSSAIQQGGATPVAAVPMTYFNCAFAAQAPVCQDGTKNGAETDVDCGGKEVSSGCPSRCGDGQGCVIDCDCDPSMLCHVLGGVRVCGAPTDADGGPVAPPARDCSSQIICLDKIKNGAETDVDCGGPDCATCVDGQACKVDTDCMSTHCIDLVCQTPSCNDGKKNVGETDVDCGGPCMTKCKNGADCLMNIDCDSGNCVNLKCGDANCTDVVQNGNETDVDCGGGACPKCDNLKNCLVNSDCKNDACVPTNGSLICLFPSCSDSTKDGDETDKDCGGSKCGPCADGLLCDVDAECTSNLCGPAAVTNGFVVTRCFPTSCIVPVDGGMGGGPPMTTQLCGGMCPLCNDGGACTKNSDCLFQACIGGVCAHATCFDNVQDGAETDKDCGGGACSPCVPGQKCLSSSDCAPAPGSDAGVGTCINNVCQ
jgi:hypothetical protein